NAWKIGQVQNGARVDLASRAEDILSDTVYQIKIEIDEDGTVRLFANNSLKTSYHYSDIASGPVGYYNINAVTRFSDLTVSDQIEESDWTVVFGSWTQTAEGWEAAPGSDGQALIVYKQVMKSGTIRADISTLPSNSWYNGFIMFDYRDENNFKFAGMYEGANAWKIGQVQNGARVDLASRAEDILSDTVYHIKVQINDDGTVMLLANDKLKVSTRFEEIQKKSVGFYNIKANTRFANLEASTEVNPSEWLIVSGNWVQNETGWIGESGANENAVLLSASQISSGIISAQMSTISHNGWHNGFIVFDFEDSGNFKYAGMYEGANRWSIGLMSAGVRTDLASFSEDIASETSYRVSLEITPEAKVNLYVNGQMKTQYGFGQLNGGAIGFFNVNAITEFDDFVIEE
ncbi:MAG: hypothetical protein Q8Q33_09085, partial [Chlamydiota bacterium]|nr:hypothetical protein [Chlamydiota bacterium]